ncbi:MAG: hypothetical protein JNL67_08170 [Planctomycetaceae bacterium]|nr:hypothetical protein [Planctomycetaceae bacterium]
MATTPERQATEAAIERALSYLVSQQQPSGAIAQGQHDTTMTSLAIMALASTGVTPMQADAKGEAMRKALDFVLQQDRRTPEGYFGQADGSRMYGHGITTLMLSEMAGMGFDHEQDDKIHEACQAGIDLILKAQRRSKDGANRGGWRYTPDSTDADLSVSVWQLMALRSAKNDGLEVPSGSIEQAIGYLKRSCTSPLSADGKPTQTESGFHYTPGGADIQFSMTAAGVLAMQVCGQYDSPLVTQATEWLKKNPPQWGARYVLYGTYYYAQGMHQQGGTTALDAERIVRELLLPRQQEDGSWNPEGEEGAGGKIYATCMAVLSLSVNYHYLPIYQR